MLFGSLSPVTTGQDRSSERHALLKTLSGFAKEAFPTVEVLIYEASLLFNAMSFSIKGQQIVALYGGLAYNGRIGKDGLLFAVLHEIGHHLAPGPRITRTSTLSCDCAADRWVMLKGLDCVSAHGLTLDIKTALSEIEAAMSELASKSDLRAKRRCFDWGRRKVTLTSSVLDPLAECEYQNLAQ